MPKIRSKRPQRRWERQLLAQRQRQAGIQGAGLLNSAADVLRGQGILRRAEFLERAARSHAIGQCACDADCELVVEAQRILAGAR